MRPLETRHRPQFRCMRLLARLIDHWSRANAIEPVLWKQRAKQNVPYGRDILNPGFAGLTAQLRFSICPSCAMESHLQAASCDSLATQNAETCAVVPMNSTSFAACEILFRAATSCDYRPIKRKSVCGLNQSQPVHTGRSPKRTGFKSRSVVPSSANSCNHLVGASDVVK